MPAPCHPVVVQAARELWQEQGLSPNQIIAELKAMEARGDFEAKLTVPTSTTTINMWARTQGWSPHWRVAARKATARDPGSPLTRVLIHLSRVKGIKFMRGYVWKNPHASIGEILGSTFLHIAEELDPGPDVYRRIKGKLVEAAKELRRGATRSMTNEERLGDRRMLESVKYSPRHRAATKYWNAVDAETTKSQRKAEQDGNTD